MATIGWVWQSRSTNVKLRKKIGNRRTISPPAGYVGKSLTELRTSCGDCPLAAECYGNGSPKLGYGMMCLAATNKQSARDFGENNRELKPGGRYSIKNSLDKLQPGVKITRFAIWGESAAIPRKQYHAAVKAFRARGISILNYTHQWRKWANRAMKTSAMASCESPKQADDAVAVGWVPAMICDHDAAEKGNLPLYVKTAAGRKLIVCPGQRAEISCNDCKLCDPSNKFWARQTVYVGIALARHFRLTRDKLAKAAEKWNGWKLPRWAVKK